MTELPRLDRVPAVATVMTPFPCTARPDASVARVLELMREHDVSHVPVADEHGLRGLVRTEDLVHADPDAAVAQLCDEPPYAVDLHESLGVVAREMVVRGADAAVVLREGRLAGIFTLIDACAVLARILGEGLAPPGDDDAA